MSRCFRDQSYVFKLGKELKNAHISQHEENGEASEEIVLVFTVIKPYEVDEEEHEHYLDDKF